MSDEEDAGNAGPDIDPRRPRPHPSDDSSNNNNNTIRHHRRVAGRGTFVRNGTVNVIGKETATGTGTGIEIETGIGIRSSREEVHHRRRWTETATERGIETGTATARRRRGMQSGRASRWTTSTTAAGTAAATPTTTATPTTERAAQQRQQRRQAAEHHGTAHEHLDGAHSAGTGGRRVVFDAALTPRVVGLDGGEQVQPDGPQHGDHCSGPPGDTWRPIWLIDSVNRCLVRARATDRYIALSYVYEPPLPSSRGPVETLRGTWRC
ncbi:heterokaryon incompatibility protein [Colletotrichum tofieldiae]|nr:heterokaryon incompatibility protein [Colletotrichum tofieldiae]